MAKSEDSPFAFDTDDWEKLLDISKDLRRPKSVKEAALRKIREIEQRTGLLIVGPYNGKKKNVRI
jgi:hypothetical protein